MKYGKLIVFVGFSDSMYLAVIVSVYFFRSMILLLIMVIVVDSYSQ